MSESIPICTCYTNIPPLEDLPLEEYSFFETLGLPGRSKRMRTDAGATAVGWNGGTQVTIYRPYFFGVPALLRPEFGPALQVPQFFRLFTFLLDKNGQLNYNIDITEPKAWI